jgi:uncharacterized phage protein gp47/JayE
MAGLTDQGFQKATLDEIRSGIEASLRLKFGRFINLLPSTVLGYLVGMFAEREAALWDLAEATYFSQYPDTASGVNLDNAIQVSGTTRLAATASRVLTQIFFGTVGTVVPAATTQIAVSGNALALFKPDADVTLAAGTDEVQHISFNHVPTNGAWAIEIGNQITSDIAYNATASAVQAAIRAMAGLTGVVVTGDYTAGFDIQFSGDAGKQNWATIVFSLNTLVWASGAVAISATTTTQGVPQAQITMTAIAAGPTQALAGTLSVITTPVTGLTGTKNLTDAIPGTLVETDSALRQRRRSDLQKNGSGSPGAIRSRLLEVAGVTQAIVFENDTLATVAGQPAKSMWCFVQGGAAQEIANALFKYKSGGIQYFGTILTPVIDSQGISHTIGWDRPVERDVYITLVITKTAAFPSNGIAQVIEKLLAYGASLQVGDDVIVNPSMIVAFGTVPGIVGIDLKVGFSPSPSSSANLVIAINELASFDSSRMVVTAP